MRWAILRSMRADQLAHREGEEDSRDEDFMAAAAIAVAWSEESPIDEDAEAGATRLRRDLHAICDSCMPRPGAPRRGGAVYWWSEEIARLRETCIYARRRYTRSRRWQ